MARSPARDETDADRATATREAASPTAPPPQREPEFVEALARGLNVLASFSAYKGPHGGGLTLSEIAKRTSLSRGTARRLLLTLKTLSYVDSDGRHFWLTPKVLGLSNAYLTPLGLGDAAKAVIKTVTEELQESSSIGVLDGHNIVYVARVEVNRLYSSGIYVGTRLPAHCTSIGRVLLANLDADKIQTWLDEHELHGLTKRTITGREALLEELSKVKRQGFAIIDEELEIGIRSVAVPIVARTGRILAALNASSSTARTSLERLTDVFLPTLRQAARDLSVIMDW